LTTTWQTGDFGTSQASHNSVSLLIIFKTSLEPDFPQIGKRRIDKQKLGWVFGCSVAQQQADIIGTQNANELAKETLKVYLGCFPATALLAGGDDVLKLLRKLEQILRQSGKRTGWV
jgi:hypothetical protein